MLGHGAGASAYGESKRRQGRDSIGDQLRRVTEAVDWGVLAHALLRRQVRPQRALGRLEEWLLRLAELQRVERPTLYAPGLVLAIGDHGVAKRGVSGLPQSTTAALISALARGATVIDVVSREFGVSLHPVDIGSCNRRRAPWAVVDRRVVQGTGDIAVEAALRVQDAEKCVRAGAEWAARATKAGCDAVGLGEIGIGNTTVGAAWVASRYGWRARDVVGPGTGVSGARLARKVETVEQAVRRVRGRRLTGIERLAELGGAEVCFLAGVAGECARRSVPVICDGLVSSVAAAAAEEMGFRVRKVVFFAHQSREPGHKAILDHFGDRPLLSLELAIGEGVGAVLALSLFRCSTRIMADVACFRRGPGSRNVEMSQRELRHKVGPGGRRPSREQPAPPPRTSRPQPAGRRSELRPGAQ